MGGAGRRAAADSRDQRVAGHLLAVDGSCARTGTNRGASSLQPAPRCKIGTSLFNEPIQSSSRHVGLELAIPLVGVELREPGAKLSPFLIGQVADGILNLLNDTHIMSLPRATTN